MERQTDLFAIISMSIQFSDVTRIQVCNEALRRGVGVGSRRGDDAHIESSCCAIMPVGDKDISRPGLTFWNQIGNLEARLKSSRLRFFEN
jgi:hypothetical protein